VAPEGTRGRKLTQAVPDHGLGYKDFNMSPSVVDRKLVSDKVRRNLTIPGPGFDGTTVPASFLPVDLGQKIAVYVWSFFAAS